MRPHKSVRVGSRVGSGPHACVWGAVWGRAHRAGGGVGGGLEPTVLAVVPRSLRRFVYFDSVSLTVVHVLNPLNCDDEMGHGAYPAGSATYNIKQDRKCHHNPLLLLVRDAGVLTLIPHHPVARKGRA